MSGRPLDSETLHHLLQTLYRGTFFRHYAFFFRHYAFFFRHYTFFFIRTPANRDIRAADTNPPLAAGDRTRAVAVARRARPCRAGARRETLPERPLSAGALGPSTVSDEYFSSSSSSSSFSSSQSLEVLRT